MSSQEFNLKEEKLSHLDISSIVKIINLMGVSSNLTSLNINGISFDGKEYKIRADSFNRYNDNNYSGIRLVISCSDGRTIFFNLISDYAVHEYHGKKEISFAYCLSDNEMINFESEYDIDDDIYEYAKGITEDEFASRLAIIYHNFLERSVDGLSWSFLPKGFEIADDGIIFHDLNGRIILLDTNGEIKTIDGNNVCRFGKISTILNRIHYDEVISRVKKALLLRKQIEADFEKAIFSSRELEIFAEILSQNIYSDKREKYISKRLSNDELSAILNKVS